MKNFVPLRRVVNAAIVDTYSDVGATQHRYSHWAARGLQELIDDVLRLPIRRVLIPVDKISMTASLPIDFDEEIFVGYIVNHKKIPIFVDVDLVREADLADEGRCKSCKNLDISEDFNYSYTTNSNSLVFNDASYDEVVEKKLYPDGNYWQIKNTPFLNTETNSVEFRPSKKFITKLEKEECGCIKRSGNNEAIIKKTCPEIYNCNYCERTYSCNSGYGGYRILEESGIIQLDPRFKPDYLYLEHTAFMPKIDGEYLVPKVAFETLVAYTKFKAIENKPRSPLSERGWHYDRFVKTRKGMTRKLGRVKLSTILHLATRIPKMDISNSNFE